jgi:hypothetical protein
VKKNITDPERRLQRRLENLGTNDPRCLHCGEDDPFCLELHEPGGREFCDISVIECRNCHRKLEDLRNDHPKRLSKPPTDLECIAHFLLGLADWLQLLVGRLREFAAVLLERVRKDLSAGEGVWQ